MRHHFQNTRLQQIKWRFFLVVYTNFIAAVRQNRGEEFSVLLNITSPTEHAKKNFILRKRRLDGALSTGREKKLNDNCFR